jgi:hypothetical protein
MLKTLGIWIGLFVLVIAALLFSTRYFLQPMNTDLSVVGQGRPALVLAYENFSPDSGAALNQLNRIRDDYEPHMAFAVADLGAPQGQTFAQKYNLFNGAAVFLSAEGKPIRVVVLSSDEQALRELLDEKLALVGIER